ncbi:MAG: hypothetical protein ABSA53_35000 [Streptosporangiaceae bacterium]|jgi:hypothetical protein
MGQAATGDAAGGQLDSDAATLAEIGRDYPGWRPWRSSAARWWAVRLATRTPADVPVEWARTVDGDTARDLRAALAAQEELTGHASR